MDGSGEWAAAYARAQQFVSQLTLLEKINLTTGVGRSMRRKSDYNSAFPAGGTVAASWDRGLWYRRGYEMGTEMRGKGVDVQLGPVVGPLGRIPAGGRNWEGFSPDPVLSGIAVAQTIHGIQDAGVVATTKHYIGNEQEHFRRTAEATAYGFNVSESMSSNIDDTTLHELYLWPFADAVRAGTGAIMCSYNQINNSYGCQNSYLLNYILKGELGFQGFVMSDWEAQHSGVSNALAGMDMAMPGDVYFLNGASYWGANLTLAVINGSVPEWRVDDMATRIMAAYYLVGRDEAYVPTNFNSWSRDVFGYRHPIPRLGYGQINYQVDVRDEHGRSIRNQAARSTVLLKNTGVLPLSGDERFTAVFGSDATENPRGPNGCPDRACDNGTLAMGWGSGTADFPYLITPLEAIKNEVLSNNGIIQSVTDDYAYNQIAALAGQASHAIVFVNSNSGEGYLAVEDNEGDRQNLTLWHDGNTLVQNVTARCNNTIVVIHSTGPVITNSFANNPNVTAILWAGLPGEQSGNSIADILYGRINPAGKLPFTIGSSRQEYGSDILYQPNNGGAAPQDNFYEGNFIDYRAFDRAGIEPIFEFGHGLTYTSFEYSNLNIIPRNAGLYIPTTGLGSAAPVLGNYSTNLADYQFPANFSAVPLYIYPYLNVHPPGARDGSPQPRIAAGGAPGGNPQLYDVLFTITATITNNGTRNGEEIAQLYVNLGGPNDPVRALRNFDRLSINTGMSATFVADITRRDLSNWDTVTQNWFISDYPKMVYVGSSSRNLPLSGTLEL
ncbi:hypothetical protein H2199_007142 [Coniosporium tulheliwenetii]|uniref:Uncharacterized protein n=1 Tax=Coniosporium tulheliwenetii TaxID=3383036 RepID=A0ACC2YSR6_9PEZI|nr:hypothetical protein H2199_007142 [Cladosporium sp. JES 115]